MAGRVKSWQLSTKMHTNSDFAELLHENANREREQWQESIIWVVWSPRNRRLRAKRKRPHRHRYQGPIAVAEHLGQ